MGQIYVMVAIKEVAGVHSALASQLQLGEFQPLVGASHEQAVSLHAHTAGLVACGGDARFQGFEYF